MANSDSRFLIVLEAREKLALKTGELSRSARSATNRLLKLVSELGEQRDVVTALEAFLEATSRFSQAVWSAADGALRFRSRIHIWGARAEARIRAAEETGKFPRFARSAPERIIKAMPRLRAARLIVRARRRTRELIGKYSRSAMSISGHISTARDSLGPRLAVVETRRRLMAWLSELSRPAQLTSYRVLKARERLRERRAMVEARERVAAWRGKLLLLGDSVANKVLEGESRWAEWEPMAGVLEKASVWNSNVKRFGRSIADRIYDRKSRLARWGKNVLESALFSRAASNLGSLTRGPWRVLQEQSLWVIVAGAVAIVIAGRMFISALAGPSPNVAIGTNEAVAPSLDPESALAAIQESGFELPEISEPSGIIIPFELFAAPATPPPAGEFGGAYVLGVTHLSDNSSMVRMFVPSVPEGSYHAIVAGSEELDYQCVTLEGLVDRLYCVGPRLHGDGLIRMSLFRINEADGLQELVFETEYYFVDSPVPTVSTPVSPTIYGGGFTWPDRFDQAKVQREEQSSEMLWPLSGLFAFVPLAYRILAQREQKQRGRLVNTPKFDPVH